MSTSGWQPKAWPKVHDNAGLDNAWDKGKGGKGGMKGMQKGSFGSSLPFKAPPSMSAASSATADFSDTWDEPPTKRMKDGNYPGQAAAPWRMGGPPGPPPASNFEAGIGGVVSKSSSWGQNSWGKNLSPPSKGGPPSKGPPGPPPPSFGGGGGFLFGGAGVDSMNVQLQNETERLRQERVHMEEERKQLEEMMEQRRLQEEERKKAEEEAERLRIEQEEQRKLKEEQRKLEEETKKAEAEEAAKKLQGELDEMVKTAEEMVQAAVDRSNAADKEEEEDDEVIKTCDELDTDIGESTSALKLCADFMSLNHLGLIGASEETRQKAAKFRERTQLASRSGMLEKVKVANRRKKAIANQEAEVRRVAAVKAAEKQEKMFKQYDVDEDGKLNAAEIMEFVKGEYDFEFPMEKAQAILKQDAFLGVGGVSFIKFAHLKMLIGIARNEAMAKQRKIEKEKKDKEDAIAREISRKLAVKQTAQVLEGIKLVEESMAGIEAEVAKAEKTVKPLIIVRGRGVLMGDAVHDLADEVEQSVEAARDFLAAAKDQASSMAGVPNDKLEPTVIPGCAPARQLFFRLDVMEKRLTTASKAAQAARDRVVLAQKKAQLMREANEAAQAAAYKRQQEYHEQQKHLQQQQQLQQQQLQQQQLQQQQQQLQQQPAATDMTMLGMPDIAMPGIPMPSMPPMPGMPLPGVSLGAPQEPVAPVAATTDAASS